jgi:aryl-alcohol dehydrogenase-like predicted oxidoreductase
VRYLGVSDTPAWKVAEANVAARHLAQLEDNLKAPDVKLTVEDVAHLNEKTKPVLGFPANG